MNFNASNYFAKNVLLFCCPVRWKFINFIYSLFSTFPSIIDKCFFFKYSTSNFTCSSRKAEFASSVGLRVVAHRPQQQQWIPTALTSPSPPHHPPHFPPKIPSSHSVKNEIFSMEIGQALQYLKCDYFLNKFWLYL
jgi:hypothetical protein